MRAAETSTDDCEALLAGSTGENSSTEAIVERYLALLTKAGRGKVTLSDLEQMKREGTPLNLQAKGPSENIHIDEALKKLERAIEKRSDRHEIKRKLTEALDRLIRETRNIEQDVKEARKHQTLPGGVQPLFKISSRKTGLIAISPDGKRLAIEAGNEVEVWDLSVNPPTSRILASGGNTWAYLSTLSFTADGLGLIAKAYGKSRFGGGASNFNEAHFWDLSSQTPSSRVFNAVADSDIVLTSRSHPRQGLIFKFALNGKPHGELQTFAFPPEKPSAEPPITVTAKVGTNVFEHADPVRTAPSPPDLLLGADVRAIDANTLVFHSGWAQAETFYSWNLRENKIQEVGKASRDLYHMALSENGNAITGISAGEKIVTVRSVPSGDTIYEYREHSEAMLATPALSANARYLTFTLKDKNVALVVDLRTKAPPVVFPLPVRKHATRIIEITPAVTISADERTLYAVLEDGTVTSWDLTEFFEAE